MADTSTCIVRASLRGRLYRDIELPSSKSLEDLAAALAEARLAHRLDPFDVEMEALYRALGGDVP